MNEVLSLGILLDLLVFEDLKTANENLAPYRLKARWIDADRGEVEIVNLLGQRLFTLGSKDNTDAERDFQNTNNEATDTAGAELTSAQEDSEVEGADADYFQRSSEFSGTVREGETDPRALTAEENFRSMLTNPDSSLTHLLGFYAHGILTPSQVRMNEYNKARNINFSALEEAREDALVLDRIRARMAGKATVKSTSDERTVKNTMRSSYRVLNDDEKKAVDDIKVMGTIFVDYLEELGQSRENSIAKTKMEEAVMWAVKGLTA